MRKVDQDNFLQELSRKNEKALEYVVDVYGGLIKTIVKRHLRGLTDYQEECINDVFLAVWQHSRSYDPEKGSFEKWLGGVTRYKALTYKRKYLNRQQAAGLEEIQEPGEESRELSQLVEELSDETEAFLSCLKEEDRFLFRQLFIEELEPDEVARKNGIKRENLYNRISRGKKKIRSHFQKQARRKEALIMRDLYEVFNDFNMEEEKDLEVMNDLEKQKWKKKLRKEIRKPMKTGKKVAVSAGCLGIAAGLFVLLTDSEVLAVAKQAVEETYRSIAVWVGGTPEENDYVQEVYGKATANGREITIVDMIVDEDLLQISYRDRDLDIENFLQGGYVSSNPAEETKDSSKYFLDAELLVDGKPAGSGAVSMISLSSETNAIDGNFCIYTGDFGVDMSKVEEAELILRQRYEEAEEEWDFSLDLEKRNLKDTTRNQELSQSFDIEDGRSVEIYRYAENEGARKLYVKVTRPENWDPDKFYCGYLQFRGITDEKQKVLFEQAAGDIYLINRNINSNTRSITITPEVIPRGEVGEAVPEEGIPVGESFTIQVNN